MKHLSLPLVLVVLLFGCKPPVDTKSMVTLQSLRDNFSAMISGQIDWAEGAYEALDQTRKLDISLTLPSSATDVYFLLTNTSSAPEGTISLSGVDPNGSRSASRPVRSLTLNSVDSQDGLPRRRDLSEYRSVEIPKLSRSMGRSVASSPLPEVFTEGTSTTTFMDALSSTLTYKNYHPSTLRKKVEVGDGAHSLHIWVADDCWIDGGSEPGTSGVTTYWKSPTHKVTQDMVNVLADKFLKDGIDDIYGWVTGIFGEEWPTTEAPSGYEGTYINGGGQVHIFLCNLNPDGTSKGVLMGYFYAQNNLAKPSNSNKKMLFALDANSLANPDDDGSSSTTGDQSTWSATDYWPVETISTLAHEFQHMIHFYQKQVVWGGNYTDTWINEMASLVTEDLVADKLKVPGPRGVDGTDSSTGPTQNTNGRLPLFNYWHDTIPLTKWLSNDDVLHSYSNAYAFGAWLTRNYGGPALWRSVVQSKASDAQAVFDAVNSNGGKGQTYASLVRQWGLATFLGGASGQAPLNYSAGSSGFSWDLGAKAYKVGSIDLYNYKLVVTTSQVVQGPYIFASPPSSNKTVAPGASYFYYAGKLSGSYQTTLTLPPHLAVTVVVQRASP